MMNAAVFSHIKLVQGKLYRYTFNNLAVSQKKIITDNLFNTI